MRFIFGAILFIGIIFNIDAQNGIRPNTGGESWNIIRFRFKLNNKWSFSVAQQLRLKIPEQLFDRQFTELGASYKIWNFKVAAGYRFQFINDDSGKKQGTKQRHRWDMAIHYEWKIKRFSNKWRVQYQYRKQFLPQTSIFLGDHQSYFRVKTLLNYNFRKWKLDPAVGFEFFIRPPEYNRNQFNKFRFSLGTDYKFNKKSTLKFKYLYERELSTWNPVVTHTLVIEYQRTLSFKTTKYKKRKKKKNDE